MDRQLEELKRALRADPHNLHLRRQVKRLMQRAGLWTPDMDRHEALWLLNRHTDDLVRSLKAFACALTPVVQGVSRTMERLSEAFILTARDMRSMTRIARAVGMDPEVLDD